ncbi:YkgJ family cysteine cluster protein [Candidatus Woesearchaeota archaeon]|nr:YkgJ family cysteine cluster protein [Candidatus Woesearchaeota archaeon]MBI2661646.1 YkgJ family cysteine cluster protein [Candidatus Woesearchaeota archaeon]
MINKNTPLKEVLKLAHPCKCDACSNGCNYGSGFLAGDDAKKLAKFLGVSEEKLREKYLEEAEQFNKKLLRPKLERKHGKPYGKCMFYDKKEGCRVHEAKPMQCKLAMGCKNYGEELMLWFMHNHIVDENDEKSMKEFGVYLKSGGKALKDA